MKREPLIRVRLSDVPFEKRMAAARRECQQAENDAERDKIMFAAMFPSDTAYFVRADALRAAA